MSIAFPQISYLQNWRTDYIKPKSICTYTLNPDNTFLNRGTSWFGEDKKLLVTYIPWKYSRNRPSYSKTVQAHIDRDLQEVLAKSSSIVTNQVKDLSSSPNGYEDDIIELERRKPQLSSAFKKIQENSDGTYTIVMEIFDIEIMDHPLMTDEIRYQKEIIQLVKVLDERKKNDIVGFLSRKLEVTTQKVLIYEFEFLNRH